MNSNSPVLAWGEIIKSSLLHSSQSQKNVTLFYIMHWMTVITGQLFLRKVIVWKSAVTPTFCFWRSWGTVLSSSLIAALNGALKQGCNIEEMILNKVKLSFITTNHSAAWQSCPEAWSADWWPVVHTQRLLCVTMNTVSTPLCVYEQTCLCTRMNVDSHHFLFLDTNAVFLI